MIDDRDVKPAKLIVLRGLEELDDLAELERTCCRGTAAPLLERIARLELLVSTWRLAYRSRSDALRETRQELAAANETIDAWNDDFGAMRKRSARVNVTNVSLTGNMKRKDV